MKFKLIILLIIVALVACKSDKSNRDYSDSDDKKNEKTKSDDPFNQMQDALKKLNDGEKVEVVNHRDLQDFLPNKVAGMEQSDIEGSTTGMLGFDISTVDADYGEGSEKLNIKIVDAGGLGAAFLSMAPWAEMKFDKSSKRGFERTAEFDGYKCFEKFDKSGDSELAIIVDDRFIVTASMEVDDFGDLRKAVRKLGLKKLGRLGSK